MQGRHVGRPPVRPRGATTTATATRCCSSSSRRARAPATPASTRASSAPSAADVDAVVIAPESAATSSARWPRDHTVVPVWRELLADLETPVAAFAELVGDEPGFLLESVEHGERWSRFSFVGRDPAATLVARDGARRGRRATLPDGVPLDQGMLAALEALLARYRVAVARRAAAVARRPRRLPRLRRRARGRAPARRPARRPRLPRRGAVGHRRARRVRPLPPAGHLDRERVRPAGRDRRRPRRGLRRGASRGSTQLAADGAPPARRAAGRAARRRRPAARRAARRWARGRTAARSRPPRSTSSPATSSRSCSRSASTSTLDADPFDVYRVLRQVNPSPYMYFVRHPEVTIVGSSPEPMVQLLDGRVISPADRRHPPPRPHRRGRPPPRRRARRAPEGARRARDARRPRPQRRRPGRASSAPSRSTS